MAKATIIEDLGDGKYTIKRNWAGRDAIQAKIDAYRGEANLLEEKHKAMPQTTDEELFEKNIVQLQFTALRKKADHLEKNMPVDVEVDVWCADYTEGLNGEVGTIDIAGEYTSDVNIRPAGIESNAYSGERDGELYPAIALGPWTSFLNQCIYPGWQKFKPLHRYAKIIEGSVDYENNTCDVLVQPTFSTHQFLNVNQGDTLGVEPAKDAPAGIRNIDYFEASATYAHSGFIDFVERNPDHPISNITGLNQPIYITDEQYIQLARICRAVDYWANYQSDRSGYGVSDYWDVMYDLGDTWYWTPISPLQGIHRPEDIARIRENPPAQTEFFFGDVPLEYDHSKIAGMITATAKDYLDFGTYLESNVDLQVQADRLNPIGPRMRRRGDCEDFVLTKMQMIIESGIIPAGNLQIMLCWIVNASSFGNVGNWNVTSTSEKTIQLKRSDLSNMDRSTYHAVLGIQTINRGFIISDQRDYGQLWEIGQLKDTHIWDVMSVSSA